MPLASELHAITLTRSTPPTPPRKLWSVLSHRQLKLVVTAHTQKELPPDLTKARKLRSAGLATSGLCLATGLTVAFNQGMPLPAAPSWLLWAVACLGTAGIACVWAAAQSDIQFELHGGRLYIQWGSPCEGPSIAPGAIQVRPTQDGRGNGAFAVADIPAGSHVGNYEGELLGEAAYWQRYPSGVSDYCVRIDREWTIDARARASDTFNFSPCHMNHSAKRRNVVRSTNRKAKRVSFFTAEQIKAGEELLIDYGPLYWKTREDKLID